MLQEDFICKYCGGYVIGVKSKRTLYYYCSVCKNPYRFEIIEIKENEKV